MGYFESINETCPFCGEIIEFQSKRFRETKRENFDGEDTYCPSCKKHLTINWVKSEEYTEKITEVEK